MKALAIIAGVVAALFLVWQFVEARNANEERLAREQAFAVERAKNPFVYLSGGGSFFVYVDQQKSAKDKVFELVYVADVLEYEGKRYHVTENELKCDCKQKYCELVAGSYIDDRGKVLSRIEVASVIPNSRLSSINIADQPSLNYACNNYSPGPGFKTFASVVRHARLRTQMSEQR